MARKRQFYRITATEFAVFEQLAQQVREDHPGSQLDYVSATVAGIILRHAPKVKPAPVAEAPVAEAPVAEAPVAEVL